MVEFTIFPPALFGVSIAMLAFSASLILNWTDPNRSGVITFMLLAFELMRQNMENFPKYYEKSYETGKIRFIHYSLITLYYIYWFYIGYFLVVNLPLDLFTITNVTVTVFFAVLGFILHIAAAIQFCRDGGCRGKLNEWPKAGYIKSQLPFCL